MRAHKMKSRDLWQIKVTGADGKRRTFYARSAEEAENKAHEYLRESTGDVRTVDGYYANVYLPTIVELAPSTLVGIASTFDNFISPRFGHRDLRSITRAEWQALFNGLAAKPSTKQIYRNRLMAMLRLAHEDGVITELPKIRVPKSSPAEKSALEFEDVAKILDAAEDDVRMVLMLCSIGLRISEALGVSAAHVDRGVLRIQQQRTTHGVTPNLKTRTSRRAVPLPFDLHFLHFL